MTQVILETAVENSNQNGAPKSTELANQKGENRKAFLEKHDPLHIVVQYADMASYYRTFSERMLLFAKLLPNLRDDDWCTAVGIVNDRCERCLVGSLDYCEKADDAHDEYENADGLLREQIDSQGILIDFVTGSRAFAELQDHVGLIIKSMPHEDANGIRILTDFMQEICELHDGCSESHKKNSDAAYAKFRKEYEAVRLA